MQIFVRIVLAALMTFTLSGCLVKESTYLKTVSELDGLTQEQAELQNRHKALKAENANLRSALAKLESDHDSMKEVKGKLDEAVTRLTNEKSDLERDLTASKGEAQQRIAELRKKISIMESENSRIRQELADLQTPKKELQKASKTYALLLDKMQGEIARGQAAVSESKGKLTLTMADAILFDTGRAEVTAHGLTVLQKVVDVVTTVRDRMFLIEGHTDNATVRGALINKYPTNWELSAARAVSVTRFLQEQGVEPDLLMAVAYGEYRPVAPNDSVEGKAKNRRIEIILVPKE